MRKHKSKKKKRRCLIQSRNLAGRHSLGQHRSVYLDQSMFASCWQYVLPIDAGQPAYRRHYKRATWQHWLRGDLRTKLSDLNPARKSSVCFGILCEMKNLGSYNCFDFELPDPSAKGLRKPFRLLWCFSERERGSRIVAESHGVISLNWRLAIVRHIGLLSRRWLQQNSYRITSRPSDRWRERLLFRRPHAILTGRH